MNLASDTLKLELLSSLKADVASIIKKELHEILGDALASIKAEVQAMKMQLASNYTATESKVVKLMAMVWDVEEALAGCSDDINGMKTILKQLTAKVTMLEDKYDNLE